MQKGDWLMLVRRFAFSIAVLILASASMPRTLSVGEVLEQPRHVSANGRYFVVERQYEAVGDFEKRRVDSVYIHRHGSMPRYTSSRVVLYEKPRRRIAKLTIDPDHRDILVSDSGRFIVTVGDLRSDALLTIYRVDGTIVRRLTASEVLTQRDRDAFDQMQDRIDFVLRSQETREVIEVSIGNGTRTYDSAARIDVATGELVEPLRDLIPTWYAEARASNPAGPPADCAGDAILIPSDALLARATHAPLPVYPPIARKARITGRVILSFVVSEIGEVLCTSSTPLPFGRRESAEAAAKQWRFQPYVVDGKPVRFTGAIAFHFNRS